MVCQMNADERRTRGTARLTQALDRVEFARTPVEQALARRWAWRWGAVAGVVLPFKRHLRGGGVWWV
jgi:hypothetical protein